MSNQSKKPPHRRTTAKHSAGQWADACGPERIFKVKDCAIIRRMGGVDTAINLRELLERLKSCPIECLFYHFCETLITPRFDDPEYRNDFALWAAHSLNDLALAEKLGVINPYSFRDLEELRDHCVEIIDDHLSEITYLTSVANGDQFMFMRAATVVFDTGIELRNPSDLIERISEFSTSSIYYHFIEARRRTSDRVDDFTFWMQFFEKPPHILMQALAKFDFYFLTLPQLKLGLQNALRSVA